MLRTPVNTRLRARNTKNIAEHAETNLMKPTMAKAKRSFDENKENEIPAKNSLRSKIPVNNVSKRLSLTSSSTIDFQQPNSNVFQCKLDRIENDIRDIMRDNKEFQHKCEERFNDFDSRIREKCVQLDSFLHQMSSNSTSFSYPVSTNNNAIGPLLSYNENVVVGDQFLTPSQIVFAINVLIEQCESLQTQINLVTEKNTKLTSKFTTLVGHVNEQFVNVLLSANNFNNADNLPTGDVCVTEKEYISQIDSMQNSIDCLEAEIRKLNQNSVSDGDKLIKMNTQIHVITAKYIDFNVRINKFLHDFRASNKEINNDKYVDEEAIGFAATSNKNVNNLATESVISNGSINNQQRLRNAYYGKPCENFTEIFDGMAYDSLIFKYTLDSLIRKRDYINRVNIDISNERGLNISINEFKVLVQLKFNNIFLNVCNFNNISTNVVSFCDGVISTIRFVIIFDKPVSHFCLKNAISKKFGQLSINLIDYEKILFLSLFRISK